MGVRTCWSAFCERLQCTNASLPDQHRRHSVAFDGPRFKALYQQWLVDPENALGMADSRALGVALDRGDGRIECVDLPANICISRPWSTSPDGFATTNRKQHAQVETVTCGQPSLFLEPASESNG